MYMDRTLLVTRNLISQQSTLLCIRNNQLVISNMQPLASVHCLRQSPPGQTLPVCVHACACVYMHMYTVRYTQPDCVYVCTFVVQFMCAYVICACTVCV